MHKYLGQINILDSKIKILEEEIEYLETKATKVNSEIQADVVQGSGRTDSQENIMVALIDAKDRLAELKGEYIEKRHKITQEIMGVDNNVYCELLYLKYVKGLNLLEIADKMHYSYRWIITLQTRALKAFKQSR